MTAYIKSLITLMVIVPVLTGCEKELTYSDLIQQPLVLKKEVERCQSLEEKTNDQITYCEMVMNAANYVVPFINEMQEDPEKFGQRILTTQEAYMKAKVDLDKAQQSVDMLKAKNTSASELQLAQDKLEQRRLAYEKIQEEVRVLLGIAGVNSPE